MATQDTIRLGDDHDQRRASDINFAGATLLVEVRGDLRVAAVDLGASLVVGREPDCDVPVDDGSLSRRHARFVCGRALTVVDLGSTNGTRVNGVLIAANTPTPLVAGDEVKLGAARLTVQSAVGAGQRRILVPHERFLVDVDDEVARARAFGRGFTLAFVRTEQGAHIAGLTRAALHVLRSVDRAAAYSDDVLELLLVETNAHDAADAVRRIVADAGVAAASAVAQFPDDGGARDALVSAGLAALGSARAGSSTRAAKQDATSSPLVHSPAMAEVMRTVDKVARSMIPVLLIGETGSGKEVIARQIHERSSRKAAPFVAVNCGALPATLVESTLFGHEKGAFTGAADVHKGVFEAAEGGLVLLDEIGESPAAAQTALLRVLDTKQITRVGATKERAVDVRLLAATHRDLDAMVAQGTFRQDLLYRLNAMTLAIPPLRNRAEEIEPLAHAFIDDANRRHGRTVSGFTDDARDVLLHYRWPGNVRELKNAIERAVVIAAAELIDVDDLPEAVRRSGPDDATAPATATTTAATTAATTATTTTAATDPKTAAPLPSSPAASSGEALSLGEELDRHEVKLILAALDRCGQSVAEAARALQVPKRTLQHRMKLLGISRRASYAR